MEWSTWTALIGAVVSVVAAVAACLQARHAKTSASAARVQASAATEQVVLMKEALNEDRVRDERASIDLAQTALARMRTRLDEIINTATAEVCLWWDNRDNTYIARTQESIRTQSPHNPSVRKVVAYDPDTGRLTKASSAEPNESAGLELFVEGREDIGLSPGQDPPESANE